MDDNNRMASGVARQQRSGPGYLLAGIRCLWRKNVIPYVWLPLAANMLLFGFAIFWAAGEVGGWIAWLMGYIPEWLGFLEQILWVLFALLALLLVAFTFGIAVNLVAAPFNALLSEAVEASSLGKPQQQTEASVWSEVKRALLREFAKLGYYLPRAVLLLLASVIPLTSPIAPVLWFVFGAWMMAIQFLDYPMDNHRVSFNDMRSRLARQRWRTLGFGMAVLVALMIPVLNLLVVPAAVAGATLLWLDHHRN